MKYNNIAGTLQWDETPDTQEGLFLQPEEAAAIDTALGSHASVQASLQEQVDALNAQGEVDEVKIDQLNEQITQLQSENAALTTDKNNLQQKVDALSKKPSGTGSAVATTTDETAGGSEEVAAHEDGTKLYNKLADEAVRRNKAKK